MSRKADPLRAEAVRIAGFLKASLTGDRVPLGLQQKIDRDRAKFALSFGLQFDGRLITITMPWNAIRGLNRAELAQHIISFAREEENNGRDDGDGTNGPEEIPASGDDHRTD